MSIPAVLSPVPLSSKLQSGAVTKKLNFNLEKQQQQNWCWAAVAVSIHKYYAYSALTQCKLVNQEFGLHDCCVSGSSRQCDQSYQTANAINSLGNLFQNLSYAVSFDEIQRQIFIQ